MIGKRRRGRQTRRDDTFEELTGMGLSAQLGQLNSRLDGKGSYLSHIRCPNDLASLWDRV